MTEPNAVDPPASADGGVTVVICTFNRADDLADLLRSVDSARTDRLSTDVLVVDNNCTDDTSAVVARHPLARRILETQQGLSHARNCGARNATQSNLLYLDDDALLPAGFFDRLAEVLVRHKPDMFGGPIEPIFRDPIPNWFPEGLENRRHASVSGFSATATLSGGNFGIRRDVLTRLGMFDTTLGMAGGSMAFGEDREMVERYRRFTPLSKQRLYYDPGLVIGHKVGREKLRKSYQLKRSFLVSRSREQIFVRNGVRSKTVSRLLALGRVILSPVSMSITALRGGFSARARFLASAEASGYLGRLSGAFSRMPGHDRAGVAEDPAQCASVKKP